MSDKLKDSKKTIQIKQRGGGLKDSPYYLPARRDRGFEPTDAYWPNLTLGQQKFILGFMQHRDLEKALESADIQRSTYQHNWANQDEFRAVFEYYQRNMVETIKRAAVEEGMRSFSTIVDLRDQNDDRRVQLQAAKTLLEMMTYPTLTKEHDSRLSNAYMILAKQVVLPTVEQMRQGQNPMEDYEPPKFEQPEFYDTDEDRAALDELERRAQVRGRAGQESEDIWEGKVIRDVEPE